MGTYACTGSSSGIGFALFSALSAQGHKVITVDLKDADIIADLSSSEGRQKAIEGILKLAPHGLDGFIPVAGLGRGLASSELITSVNYFGTVELVEGLRDALSKNQGKVVLLVSNSVPIPKDRPEYMAALLSGNEEKALEESARLNDAVCYMLGKRALVFWMQRNVMAYGRDGIRLNAVAPGPVFTPMTASILEREEYAKMMEAMLEATPFKRVGQPDEVAEAILFLLSKNASYVCGSVLYIDGGFNAHTRQNQI